MPHLNNEKFILNKNIRSLETHQTATGFIFNDDLTKILLIHHKKLDKWLGPGGHVDLGEMPHEAVVREIQEEVGLNADFIKYPQINPKLDELSESMIPSPYITMLQYIPTYKEKPEHYHYDFSYLMIVAELAIATNVRELKGGGWFTLEEVRRLNTFNIVQTVCNEVMKS